MAYQNSMKKLSFLGSRFPLRRIFHPAGSNSYTTFCKDDEPGPAVSSGRTDPVPTAGGVRAEQPPEPTCDRPRRAAAVEADQRRKTWLENLN